ncbi:MAG TPA: glycosyltransferase family 2 protein [Puia sp.]|uniref:glycosyltransferase family 2 protein n=1 Tax=Puia sp. TaxID=2045100 RepID=UPI002BDF9E6C|nr:glycosyltransferase family 2 protein [Puia sp.]HVU96485.1 glycosyltransferase family 2 protein [Puia sp.]
MIDLSIVIVNYKTPALVLDCLHTVYTQTNDLDFEVFVVDNASGDDSRKLILQAYPGVRWVQMDYNAGFARANNAAIRMAQGSSVLLLNSDTLVEENAIAGCYRSFAASSLVACGVQLLNTDRTPQITGNYFMKGGLNYLLPLPFMGSWIKAIAGLMNVKKPHVPEASSMVEVDWINGAFLMVKKAAIEKAGLLDEDFFLYSEEAEWCSRLRRLGPIGVYGQFHVIHLQGASANDTFVSEGKGYYNLYDRKGLQIMLSNFVRIRKQFGRAWFGVQLFFYWLEVPVFFLGLCFRRGDRSDRRGLSWKDFRNYCRNVGYILRTSPVIWQNKPYFYKVL